MFLKHGEVLSCNNHRMEKYVSFFRKSTKTQESRMGLHQIFSVKKRVHWKLGEASHITCMNQSSHLNSRSLFWKSVSLSAILLNCCFHKCKVIFLNLFQFFNMFLCMVYVLHLKFLYCFYFVEESKNFNFLNNNWTELLYSLVHENVGTNCKIFISAVNNVGIL